jgi:uncharacterized protein (DUF983 family)
MPPRLTACRDPAYDAHIRIGVLAKRTIMATIIRAFFDGLILRCPRCHSGRMFSSWFRMRQTCPVCGLEFERATGEITGGMGVNIVVTLILVIIAAVVVGFSTVPLAPALLGIGLAVVLFPIAFYPISRGLWVALLYVTGNNQEL